MILMVINESILETVTDRNTTQPENSKEKHQVYLEMSDMCSICYPANINAISEFFPCTSQL